MTVLKNFFKERKLNILGSAVAIALMWLVWIVAYYSVGNKLIVPSFTETAVCFFKNFASAEFWTALGGSLLRTLLAFLVSLLLAAVCAAGASLSKTVKAVLKPIITFVRILPTLAVSLIILKLAQGDRSVSPAIVTVLVLFPAIYAQLIAEAEGLDGGLAEMAKAYNISRGACKHRKRAWRNAAGKQSCGGNRTACRAYRFRGDSGAAAGYCFFAIEAAYPQMVLRFYYA